MAEGNVSNFREHSPFRNISKHVDFFVDITSPLSFSMVNNCLKKWNIISFDRIHTFSSIDWIVPRYAMIVWSKTFNSMWKSRSAKVICDRIASISIWDKWANTAKAILMRSFYYYLWHEFSFERFKRAM